MRFEEAWFGRVGGWEGWGRLRRGRGDEVKGTKRNEYWK